LDDLHKATGWISTRIGIAIKAMRCKTPAVSVAFNIKARFLAERRMLRRRIEVRGRFALPFLKNVGFFPTEFFRHLSFCFCLVAEIWLWLCVPPWAQLGLFIAPLWVSMGWYLDRGRCNRLDFYGRAPVVI
jgi:hypothetical protein